MQILYTAMNALGQDSLVTYGVGVIDYSLARAIVTLSISFAICRAN
jgi:hypothetical protein